MRLCPSVEGSASPLITHRIGVDVCMARQRTFFHKCHRCIYRGQSAEWQPEPSTLAMLDADLVEIELGAAVQAKKSASKVAASRNGAGKVSAAKTPAGNPPASKASGKAAAKTAAGKPAEVQA